MSIISNLYNVSYSFLLNASQHMNEEDLAKQRQWITENVNNDVKKIFGEELLNSNKLTLENKIQLLEYYDMYNNDPLLAPIYGNEVREQELQDLYKSYDEIYGKKSSLSARLDATFLEGDNAVESKMNEAILNRYRIDANNEAHILLYSDEVQGSLLGEDAEKELAERLYQEKVLQHFKHPDTLEKINNSSNNTKKNTIQDIANNVAEKNRSRNVSASPSTLDRELERYLRKHTSNKKDARKLYNELQSRRGHIHIINAAGDLSMEQLGTNTLRLRNRSRAGAGSEYIMKAKKKSTNNEEITGGRVAKFIGNRIWDVAGGYVVRHLLKSGTKQQNALKQYKELKQLLYGLQERAGELELKVQKLELLKFNEVQNAVEMKMKFLSDYDEAYNYIDNPKLREAKINELYGNLKKSGIDVDLNQVNDYDYRQLWIGDTDNVKYPTFNNAELEKLKNEFEDLQKKIGVTGSDNELSKEFRELTEILENTKLKGRFKELFNEMKSADTVEKLKNVDLPAKLTWKSIAASLLVGAVQISLLVGAWKLINISEDKGLLLRKALTGQKIERMYL